MAEEKLPREIEEPGQASARKKALRLGRLLGLASEQDYKPANASVAERAAFRIDKQQAQYQRNLENIYAMALSYTPSDVTGVELDPTGYINSSKWPSRSTIARCKIYGLGYSQVKSSIQAISACVP